MNEEPIFKTIFGGDWDKLPPVMHKHYANRPYSNDVTTVSGILDVMCAGPIKVFAWFFWLMQGIPPQNEKKVPVTVRFESDGNTRFFHFNRTFNFRNRDPYHFKSRMFQVHGNEVIEVMPYRLGWRMNYRWDGEAVKLEHKSYVIYAFGRFIPLPMTFLLGKGYAEERAIDENNFNMFVQITHPWWGTIYEYKGQFEVKKCP